MRPKPLSKRSHVTDEEIAQIRVLRPVDELTYYQIAEKTGRSLSTVAKIFGFVKAPVKRPTSERAPIVFKQPRTGSDSGFIRELPPECLRAGNGRRARPIPTQ